MSIDNGDESPAPQLDPELVSSVTGKHLLVGLTYIRPSGEVIEQKQLHGIVDRITEARTLIEAWRVDYNTVRPHSALGGATPEQFAHGYGGRSPAQTPARADSKNTTNEDSKPEDLSLSV